MANQIEPPASPAEPPPPPASLLRAGPVLRTVQALRRRIAERFPEAGLNRVVAELERVCEDSRERIDWIRRPRLGRELRKK